MALELVIWVICANQRSYNIPHHKILRRRRVRRLSRAARKRLWSRHRRVPGDLRRQRLHAQRCRLVCRARLRRALPGSLLAHRTRRQLTDKGDDWNRAIDFTSGSTKPKPSKTPRRRWTFCAQHCVQRSRWRSRFLHGRQSRVPVVSAVQARLRGRLLRRQHREIVWTKRRTSPVR